MNPVSQTRKVPPYPDKPNEGMVQLELIPTPMADPSIEPGSEAGSYVRLIDFVYHSTLGLRVIQKKKKRAVHRTRHTP